MDHLELMEMIAFWQNEAIVELEREVQFAHENPNQMRDGPTLVDKAKENVATLYKARELYINYAMRRKKITDGK